MPNITRIFDFIYYQNEKYPLADAFADKVNGTWVKTSTQNYIDKTNALSRALLQLGVKPADKIALITSTNRSEWNIADSAIAQLGAVTVPIYPNISESEYAYIFNHSECKYCFVSDATLFQKIQAVFPQLNFLEKVFCFDAVDRLQSFQDLIALGNTLQNQEEVEQAKAAVNPLALASIIYTSGTTGQPKGVMLSHNNLVKNVLFASSRVNLPLGKTVTLSFLPCCHVFERVLLYCYQYKGFSTYYAESIEHIAENIKEVRPNMMTVVPRLLEKVYDRIIAKGNELTGFKKQLFFWATNLAEQYEPYGANGAIYECKLKIARALILNKFKAGLGGRLNLIISGSAALQDRLPRFFTAAGINTVEGYGLTETSPVIAVNDYNNHNYKSKTVGKPIDGVTIKIAEDGEILTRSECVMMGYYKDPVKTNEVIKNGFFYTEDIGELDEDGFLRITDRKKEMFKTSGGKYVAPQTLENEFKKSLFIEQIMVVGEGEKMPVALIQPDFDYVNHWATQNKIDVVNNEQLITHPEIIKQFQAELDAINQNFGRWEQIKVFALTPNIWSVDTGELTPTLKLKRKYIKQKFIELYNKMYNH
ncbi:long-chain fatty acid--CoA ligase [Flavobacterium agricola]|uniref:Long-chain fatty acid--CoA ligase n=1 Tax=Flavobacterium agricola TaxID=2870839 RepID=A0ABY6M3N5_9FLAO|nr:long-chain fatty acid--CoA ligase [Flavobacterium agricola]UYW02038.1 long-chain fatty acid--CoA ligase [Flavobacterium agricola]